MPVNSELPTEKTIRIFFYFLKSLDQYRVILGVDEISAFEKLLSLHELSFEEVDYIGAIPLDFYLRVTRGKKI